MLELADAWAHRYGRRPAELLHSDAFDNAFDMLCLQAGRARDDIWRQRNKAFAVATEP